MSIFDVFRVYAPDECGADGYPRAWHDLGDDGVPRVGGCGVGVKDLVREQAGDRCVRCLHPYRQGKSDPINSPCDERCRHDPAKASRRVLTVHHLTGCWGREKEAKRDLRWWNLAALCQRCHLTIQGKVDLRRVWPWEHSEWFKPYVAGWYASSYLGEELSRAAVTARLDELLALELAAPVPVSAGEDAAWAERARG